jgi:competence protein ComEC
VLITGASAATKLLTVHFINVGQGDSIYIKAPNGEYILIDGGNNSHGDDVVAYLKAKSG